ncbi:MAG: TIM barrel protein [Flavobacteriaceae bacterium]|nr:TIM barrel protein [Flavobacteriaceae bacterium]
MNRETFLKQLCYAGVGVSSLSMISCKNKPTEKMVAETPAMFFKLSLAQWSLHRSIREDGLNPYEFAKLAKGCGFEGLEYVSRFYADLFDPNNIEKGMQEFITKSNLEAQKHGMENLLIMIDDEGDLSSSNEKERVQSIENHKKWIKAASAMNCHSVRLNLYGEEDPDLWKQNSIASLKALANFAAPYNINIIVENHGNLTSKADLLMEAINGADMSNCGTLPDFGNFCIEKDSNDDCLNEYDRYKGITEMMPKAFGVSAKSHDFDSEGNEKNTDYMRMLKIVKSSGYSGFIGVEYEGSELSEVEGIKATRDLLLKVGAQV